jgi:hypothetical protein
MNECCGGIVHLEDDARLGGRPDIMLTVRIRSRVCIAEQISQNGVSSTADRVRTPRSALGPQSPRIRYGIGGQGPSAAKAAASRRWYASDRNWRLSVGDHEGCRWLIVKSAQPRLGVPAQQHFLTNAKPRRSVTFAPERLSSGDPLAWIHRGLVEAEERRL